jgi:DNA modification methylase
VSAQASTFHRCSEPSCNSTELGDVVLDSFGGSGSTLLAAARTGRRARLVELDPRYCDVIRKRWTEFALAARIDPGVGALE